MIRYHVLRQTTLALRWATVKLLNLKQRADVTAELAATSAKAAALLNIERQEDKAFAKVLAVKEESDTILMHAEDVLTRTYDQRELADDAAEEDYINLCAHTKALREKIKGEVL